MTTQYYICLLLLMCGGIPLAHSQSIRPDRLPKSFTYSSQSKPLTNENNIETMVMPVPNVDSVLKIEQELDAKGTIITYFVPERLTGRVELIIADASGNTILQSVPVQTNIPSQYTYSATDLQTGVYLYGIALNGQIIKSKKMIIIK